VSLTIFANELKSSAQVTINAGTGAGSFLCTEGAAPATPTSGNDILWCDFSHTFDMNNVASTSTSTTNTSIAGVIDTVRDNSIYVTSTDGSPNWNPNELTVTGSGTNRTITLTASTSTPFVAFIAGKKVILTQNLGPSTFLLTNGTTGNPALNYVYLHYSATIGTGDIAAATIAPFYSRSQPASCTSTQQFWFDAATRLMKQCNGTGTWNAYPAIFLGVIAIDNTGAVLGIAHEPWGLDPATRMREFGNGTAGATVSNGSNTCDGWAQYTAVELATTAAQIVHTSITPAGASNLGYPGCYAWAQNPILITSGGFIDLTGLGRSGGGQQTAANQNGSNGNAGGFGGAAGAGGGITGGGPTGGNGGGHSLFMAYTTAGGGVGTSGAGPTGATQQTGNFPPFLSGLPPLGGAGAGGGAVGATNGTGGAGGSGGGGVYLKAPSIVITSTAGVIKADGGGNGTANGACGNGAATNGGTGGGGGGGTIFLEGYFVSNAITISTSGGSHCPTKFGTGTVGGDGAPGISVTMQRQ